MFGRGLVKENAYPDWTWTKIGNACFPAASIPCMESTFQEATPIRHRGQNSLYLHSLYKGDGIRFPPLQQPLCHVPSVAVIVTWCTASCAPKHPKGSTLEVKNCCVVAFDACISQLGFDQGDIILGKCELGCVVRFPQKRRSVTKGIL